MQTTHLDSCATISPLQYENQTNSPTDQLDEIDLQFSSSTYESGFVPTQNSFEPDLWNPNILSTINWLGVDAPPLYVDFRVASRKTPPPQVSDSIQQARPPTEAPISHIRPLPASVQPEERGSTAEDSRSYSESEAIGSPTTVKSFTRPIAVENTHTEAGEFYVDGQPARLPRVCFVFSLVYQPTN